MISRISKLFKVPIVRNILIMVTGTAGAQAVTMGLSPIITRIYGPEAYGIMGVFMAMVGFFGPIAALTYPIAIVLPKSNIYAKGIVRLSLYITIGFAIAVFFSILLFKQSIVQLFKLEDIASFLYLLPIVILFSGFLQVTEQWLIRTKQFAITSKVTFLQSLILQGSKVGIGVFYPFATVLVILTTLANGMKALMMLIFSKKSNHKQLTELYEEPVSIKKVAKVYNDFPIFRAPQVFLNKATEGLPVILLSILFGPASAGFYSIGRTVLSAPSLLIGKAVGDVFYPRISEAANDGESLTKLIKRATISLGALGFLPFGLVIIFGPLLFSFIFGEEWLKAGEYARWIALWIFFMFISQPSIKALPVLSAQAFHLKFTIFTLIIRTIALIGGYYLFSSDLMAVVLYSIFGAVLNIGLVYLTLQISKKFDK